MGLEPTTLSIDRVQSGDSDVTSPSTQILSAYLPLVFEVSSSLAFVNPIVQAEVQWGTAFDLIATIKKEEITVSGSDLFRFDVSNLLQTVLGEDIPVEGSYTSIVTGSEKVCAQFRVRFVQVYEDELGNIIDQDELTSSTYWVANSLVQADNADQDLSDWTIGTSAKKFLTNIPNNTTIHKLEQVQLTFLADNDTVNYAMYYEEYDLAGVAQGTTTTASTTITNRYGILPINAGEVLSNHSNMSKVDVWIQNTDGAVQASEKKTFIISQQTCKNARILFLNSLGGTDRYTFQGFKMVVKTTERVNMRKPLLLSYSRNSRGNKTIGSVSVESWELSSGVVLSEEMLDWLDEMLTSTNVSKYVSPGVYDPIMINNESTTTFNTNELNQFVITFDMARQKKTHIG